MKFQFLIFITLSYLNLVYNTSDTCFDSIKLLAEKDKCLTSRLALKTSLAQSSANSNKFYENVLKNKDCNGTDVNCGMTASWVSEVFLGIQSEYDYYKKFNDFNGDGSGYELLIGEPARKHFHKYKDNKARIIYILRHTTTQDHVWIIEQKANLSGYRIYQSYHDAYSMRAWLSTNIDGYFNNSNMDIKLFVDLKEQCNDLIKGYSSNKMNLTNFDDSLFIGPLKDLKNFVVFVRDYGETEAVSLFKRAWEKYGKGKSLTWSELDEYLVILAKMTKYLYVNDKLETPFDLEVYDDWINLFSAANPVIFPNIPANAINNIIVPNREDYRFEIKTFILDEKMDCDKNYRLLSEYAYPKNHSISKYNGSNFLVGIISFFNYV